MLRWIVGSSLHRRVFIALAAAAMLIFGAGQLRTARVDLLPEFGPSYVEVQTEALGLSAAEVEDLVTIPLEEGLLSGLPWVASMRSESIPGLSSIILVFEPGADQIRGRQMVQERLTQARVLPNVSKPPAMLEPRSSSGRAAIIGLSSQDLSMIDLGVLARWTIRPRLMGVPGVSNVAIWGQRERQVAVQVDPKRLRDYAVTLDQVIETTGNALWVSPLSFLEASSPGAGGFIDTAGQRLTVQHLLAIRTPEDLAGVRIEGCTGGVPSYRRHVDANCPDGIEPRAPLRIGDIAAVVEDHQPLIGDAIVNDGTGLLLVIEKLPWANTPDVTRGVEAALDDLRPGLKGVAIDSAVFRPATTIELAQANLGMLALLGGLLAIVALGALVLEWRRLAICLVAIPLSLIAATLVLEFRGVTLNAMVVAGLVLGVGVVVHDTVVGIDHLVRRLRQHRDAERARLQTPESGIQRASDFIRGSETRTIIIEASLETARSFAYATLIVALSVVPVFALEGLSGAFLQPLVLSYALAVLASFVVALTVAPALGLLLLSRSGAERHESPLVGWAQRRYSLLLDRMVRVPQVATIALVLLGAVGLVVVPRIGQAAFPSFKEQNVLIRANAPESTSLPAMMQLLGGASHELRAIPGVRTVGAGAGRAVLSDRVSGVNTGEIWVSIDPAADYGRTVKAIEDVAARHPGLSPNTTTYSEDRMRAAYTGSTDDLVVRVYGLDFTELRQKAEEVRQSMTQVDGILAPRIDDPQIQQQTIDVEVDLSRALLYGVKPGDVRRSVTSLISGISVGSLFVDQKVFDVVVIGVPEIRQSVAGVSEILVDTLTGGHAALSDVAAVRVGPSPSGIKRDSVSRYVDVTASVRGRSLDAVVGDVQHRLQAVQFPREFHAEVLGDLGKRQAGQQRFLEVAAAAALGIFLLLQAAFGSWRLAALAFLMLPVAVVGGLVAASVGGGILTLGSYAGCLVLIALAARDAILVVGEYQRHRRSGDASPAPDLLLRVTRERLPVVLTTAVVVGLPSVLLILLGERPGFEILRPMSIVVLGGLITSMVVTLFIMPTLCVRFLSRQTQRVPSTMAAGAASTQSSGGVLS